MSTPSRTLLLAIGIVAFATLLAFLFNTWRPNPMAWVRTTPWMTIQGTPGTEIKQQAAPEPSPVPDATSSQPEASNETASVAEPFPPAEPQTPTALSPSQPESPSTITPQPGSVEIITLPDAFSLFTSGNAIFLDARDAQSYEGGHIQGAINVPVITLDSVWSQLQPHLEGKTIITYCDGEACPLGHELAEALHMRGISPIFVLVNGWSVWQAEHLPIATGPNPEP
jgi:rhodanese-related sulfurtransferase